MNDEETKGVIVERGWFQGLKQMAGFPDQIVPKMHMKIKATS